jgi:hypothetical protein
MEKFKEVPHCCAPVSYIGIEDSALTTISLLKQKIISLRAEADENAKRADEAEARNKSLEQELLSKEQEIVSLNHKVVSCERPIDVH